MLSAAPDERGFPFGSGERHTQSVPFTRALGTRWLGLHAAASEGGPLARLALPCRPAVCTPQGAIDIRALAALMDHAGAPASYGAHAAQGATATLELRIDLTLPPRPGADLWVETRCLSTDSQSALVVGEARHPDAQGAVARMTGRYVVGLGPGRANDGSEAPEMRSANAARYDTVQPPAARCFDELLGARQEAEGVVVAFQPWLVGSVALPALHGGVVAAGLISAAAPASAPAAQPPGLRLVSLTLQFLRAGLASEARFEARCVKSGARAAYVEAVASGTGSA